MDFDLAFVLLWNSLKSPNQLYVQTKRLKSIRNHWHRDDPCVTAVIIGLLIVTGILYGIIIPNYKEASEVTIVRSCVMTAVKFVIIQFMISGIVIASMGKWIAENYMVKSEKKSSKN